MYLLWNRAGILVLVFVVLAFVGSQYFVDQQLGEGVYAANFWPKAVAGLAAAAFIAPVGFLLNRKLPYERKHLFFFIPMEYWAIVCILVTAIAWARLSLAG